MSGRCLVAFLAVGIGIFNLRSATAQPKFGVVQGAFAEENKTLSRRGAAIQMKQLMLGLTVPVLINGFNSTWWVVDTGAPACVIDPNFFQKLVLPASKVRGSKVTKIDDFQIGNFHCDGVGCLVTPIGELKELKLPGFQGRFDKTGVIGISLLARYGALLNCRTQQIFLSAAGNLGMSRQKYEAMGFTYVPLVLTPHNRLELIGTIGSATCSFIIDTGAFATTLDESIRSASKVPYWESMSKIGGPFHDFKNASVSFGTASDFKLGNYDAKGTKVSFANLHLAESGFTHQFGGILGLDFLYYRSAIIDIGGRALYLKPYSTAH